MRIVYKILRILLKIAAYVIAFVLLLPVLIIIALQIPPVQHFATNKITQTLSAKIHSKVELEKVSLGFLRTLQLKGVYIEDQGKDTLLYAKKLEVDVSLFKLINHEVLINTIKLDGVYANVYRNASQKDFNYAYILKAFQSSDTTTDTTKSAWKIELNDVKLSNIRLRYDDVPGGTDLETSLLSLSVDLKTLGLDDNHAIINDAKIDGLKVAFNLSKADSTILQETKDTTKTTSSASSKPFAITVDDFSIDRSRLVYNNYLQKAVARGIDYNRIDVYNLKGDFAAIDVKGSDVALTVKALSLKEKSGLVLNDLNGKINMLSTWLTVDLNKLVTDNSTLHDAVHVDMPMGKGANIEETTMKANFREEVIAMKDLLYFMPDLDSMEALKDKKLSFSGDLKGKLKDFTFRNVALKLDGQTSLKADIVAKGLPNIKKTYFDLNVKDLNVNSGFIITFMPKNASSGIDIPALGQINIKGKTKGYATNSASDFTIRTAVGTVAAKATLVTDTAFKPKSYKGDVLIVAFDLGKVLKQKDIGKLTMQASATGEGMNVTAFSGTIASAEYNKYVYHKISINGSMINKVAKVNLVSKDSSITSDLKLVADLKNSSYKAKGKLTKVDLYDTHFMSSPLTFGMDINADVQFKTIDSVLGYVRLHKLNFTNNTQSVDLDSFIVNSTLNNGRHTFTINSPLLQAEVAGKFDVNELPGIYNFSLRMYKDTTKFPIPKQKHTKNIELVLKAGNLSPLTQLFLPDLTALDSITFTGSYTAIPGILKLAANVQSITYGTNHVSGISLATNGNSLFTNFTAGVESIITGSNTIDKTIVAGTLKKDNLKFNLKVYDQKAPTHLNLDAQILTVHKDTFIVNLLSASIFIKGKQWNVNDKNEIVYSKDYLVVKDFELNQGNQKIALMSTMIGKQNNANAILANINLGDLAELAGLTSYKIKGALNGKVQVTDMFTTLGINADVKLDSLAVNNQPIGTIDVTAQKKTSNDNIDVTLALKGPSSDMSVSGYYSMAKGNLLQFDIRIAKLALAPWQPFAKASVYELNGNITGNFKVGGTASAPSIVGNLLFDGLNEIGLVATNSLYKLTNQQVIFNETSVQLNRFTIQDSIGNSLVANGYMFHKDFKNMKFAMNFDTDNFELVDSDYSPEASVYGKLFAALHVKLNGPLENLVININAKTNKGTKLYVPLASSEGSDALPSYVHFDKIEEQTDWSVSSPEQKKVKKPTKNAPKVDLSKFDIRGNFNVTNDAQLNIVIDPVNGDQVLAIGHGQLSLDFNSQNDINLYGMYTIDSGSYNFSFAGVIKKNFKIKKGSTISWAGDPENAKLNLTAIYVTTASRYDLISDQASFMSKDQLAAAKRVLPVDVYLNIGGQVETPALTFDLSVPEGNDPLNGSIVTQRISQIRNDPNELNRQVFSLIVLSKFMSMNGTTSGGSGNLAMEQLNESVSRMLNQELNKLSGDYLKGIQFNVNVTSLDPTYGAMAQNAQFNATKQINSRISVSAGGSVNMNSNYGNGQFAGDYDVYYRVNPNGTINLKFFRTSSQNMYTNGLNTQTGFSVNTRREFNKWRNVFRRAKNKKDEDI